MEIEKSDSQETGMTKFYNVDLVIDDGRELSISVTEEYQDVVEMSEISNFEYIEGQEDFTREELEEIEQWIEDNEEEWKNISLRP